MIVTKLIHLYNNAYARIERTIALTSRRCGVYYTRCIRVIIIIIFTPIFVLYTYFLLSHRLTIVSVINLTHARDDARWYEVALFFLFAHIYNFWRIYVFVYQYYYVIN